MPRYQVTYTILSAIDHESFPPEGIVVTGDDEESARREAVRWIEDHDYHFDLRIDPQVRVLSIKPLEKDVGERR